MYVMLYVIMLYIYLSSRRDSCTKQEAIEGILLPTLCRQKRSGIMKGALTGFWEDGEIGLLSVKKVKTQLFSTCED